MKLKRPCQDCKKKYVPAGPDCRYCDKCIQKRIDARNKKHRKYLKSTAFENRYQPLRRRVKMLMEGE